MRWAHLPEAGGLYDQHPDLLDGFRYIFAKKSEREEAEMKRRERERKQGRSSRVAGRR